MLTIREALALPVFASARLVAGGDGLDNQINWVHIVDIPEAKYEWQRQGVLLLTAGFGLRDNLQGQEALVPILVRQGFAGMVLATGYYFEETPAVIRQAADRLGFPVIETPPDLLFIEITETVLERIISRQYTLLQQSTEIFSQLTELVLQGVDLTGLATTLASLIERSVTIEDPAFNILAAAQYGPVDELRQQSVDQGRTPPDKAQLLLAAGIYERLRERLEPVSIRPMRALGMSLERYVAPIVADRQIHGYIWVIVGGQALAELDEMAIRHGATVAALILFKEQAVREAAETLRGDFFEQLLNGRRDPAHFSERARQLNYRPERGHQVLVIAGSPQAGGAGYALAAAVEQWLQRQGQRSLPVRRDRHLVVLMESDDDATGKQFAARLARELEHPAQRLLVGVGRICGPDGAEGRAIQHSYEEAQEAIRIGRSVGRPEGVIAFDELGLLYWLNHLPPERRSDNIYLQHIRTLAAYDAERNAELAGTLEAYLDHGGTQAETAQALFIHRNTLLHRLERIEQICSVDLHDPWQRLNLHAAVKSYRLHKG